MLGVCVEKTDTDVNFRGDFRQKIIKTLCGDGQNLRGVPTQSNIVWGGYAWVSEIGMSLSSAIIIRARKKFDVVKISQSLHTAKYLLKS